MSHFHIFLNFSTFYVNNISVAHFKIELLVFFSFLIWKECVCLPLWHDLQYFSCSLCLWRNFPSSLPSPLPSFLPPFLPFYGCTCYIWKLPGQGLNPRCGCDLNHSCGHAGILTHCARLGIKPASPQRQAGSITYCATAGTPGNIFSWRRKVEELIKWLLRKQLYCITSFRKYIVSFLANLLRVKR